VVKEHHEDVAAQVDHPLGFVGQIAERILVALYEGPDSIAAAVRSLQIEAEANIALSRTDHSAGRVPDQAGLEISAHPGAHGEQDGAANHGLAQAQAARQLKREPSERAK
jgi:hypothetical protein